VADEVALRETALREEDLVEVRDLDVVAADADGAEATRHEITLRGDGARKRERDHGSAGSPHIPRRLVTASRTVCSATPYSTVGGASPFVDPNTDARWKRAAFDLDPHSLAS